MAEYNILKRIHSLIKTLITQFVDAYPLQCYYSHKEDSKDKGEPKYECKF